MASVAGHPTVGLPGPNARVACKQSCLFATFIDLSCTSTPTRRRSERTVSHHRSGPSTAHRRIVQQMCLDMER